MLLPDWARWGARLVGFTRERAAIIYDEREFDEEDLPTSHQDLASFIGENDSVHFLQDCNLVISRAVWVQNTAREPEKPLPTHPAILHPPSSARGSDWKGPAASRAAASSAGWRPAPFASALTALDAQ